MASPPVGLALLDNLHPWVRDGLACDACVVPARALLAGEGGLTAVADCPGCKGVHEQAVANPWGGVRFRDLPCGTRLVAVIEAGCPVHRGP